MNALIYITPEEWDLIETWLDPKDSLEKALLNKKLTEIPNVAKKIEHVNKTEIEIEDSIRRSIIREFHHCSFDIPDISVEPNIPDDTDNIYSPDKLHSLDIHQDIDREYAVYKNVSGLKKIAVKKIKTNTVWYTSAAILALLFGFFWMMNVSKTSESIFAKTFKPDIGLPLKMSTENTLGFYEGMLDYKQENYDAAIEKWQVLLETKPRNDTLNYFLGVTHLALGNAAKSLEYLDDQSLFLQGIFKEDAPYYAALAYIKEGEFEEAGALLQKYPSKRNNDLLNEINAHL